MTRSETKTNSHAVIRGLKRRPKLRALFDADSDLDWRSLRVGFSLRAVLVQLETVPRLHETNRRRVEEDLVEM